MEKQKANNMSQTLKECVVCGGAHHYYNCPNDSTNEEGSIIITPEDMRLLITVVEAVKSDEYRRLHKKLLDISIMGGLDAFK